MSLWNPAVRLVLASNSATRAQLLGSAGIPFSVNAAAIDERAIEAEFFARGGVVEELASTLAAEKALDVSRRFTGAYCLGSDQVLSLHDRVLHKSTTTNEAAHKLAELSGNVHRLTSAFAIARDGAIVHTDVDSAEMAMRSLDANQIAVYLNCVGPAVLSSVGHYHWEGVGVHLFERVEGDHSTILGLPLLKLLAWLRQEGALLL